MDLVDEMQWEDVIEFETLEEAEHYAYMVRLTGRRCSINNNWTGAVYQDEE